MIETLLERLWYNRHPAHKVFIPLSWCYQLATALRRSYYQRHRSAVSPFRAPIVIVGNINTGGVGKTPVVIALVKLLQEAGYNPGIVSRGYGGSADGYPMSVSDQCEPRQVGDEAILLTDATSAPMVVDPDRVRAVKHLLATSSCDIVISDDGLQHYPLWRDIEIAVVDGRSLGNGYCLPAGPLREPASRLLEVDFVIYNSTPVANHGYAFQLEPDKLCSAIDSNVSMELNSTKVANTVHAMAGIGHPQRFFTMLEDLGYTLIKHRFPDHYHYNAEDLNFNDDLPIVMTAKDAVKCRQFANSRCWYLALTGNLEQRFKDDFLRLLDA